MTESSTMTVFTLREIAFRCGVEDTFIERLVALGVLHPHGAPPRFAGESALLVHKVVRLQRDLGVNFEGAAVILDLLERIEALEHELRALRGR